MKNSKRAQGKVAAHKRPRSAPVEYQWYRAAFENAADFIYVINRKGIVLSANKSGAAFLGKSPKELEGKALFDIFPDQVANEFSKGSDRVFDTGGQIDSDSRIIANGREFWISSRLSPLIDHAGHVSAVLGVTRDITERKRAEKSLRQSEERFRELFDRMLDGIYRSTHDGHFVSVNPAFVKMFGYSSKEEMLKIKDIKKELYFSPEERGSHILDSGTEDVEVYRMRRKDGSEIWVEDHGRYIHDEQGGILYHEGILRDVTERMRAEEAIRKSEERYRTTLDTMLEGCQIIGFDWRYRYVNEAVAKQGRRRKEELLGHTMLEVYPGIEKTEMFAILRDAMEQRMPARLENEFVFPDGTRGWFDLSIHPVAEGIFIVSTDTTERKRLEEELKQYSTHLEDLVREESGKLLESESRYRRLFDSSPISLWEEDFSKVKLHFNQLRARGIKDLRKHLTEHPEELSDCAGMVKILNVNDATLSLYGARSADDLRVELGRLFTHEFEDNFREELVALGEGRARFESEFENQTLTGETKHVSLILTVVPGYEDTLAKVLVAVIDLTERKKMELRLQHAQRLAAIGETAAMVGHDLRNPLQGIASAVHLLKDELLTEKERTELLHLIQRSVAYADGIVKDLLDYSGRMQLRLTDATPKSIMLGVMETIKVPSNVTIRNLAEDQPTLRVDQERIRRIFINLAENAIDAMPNGGTITIRSRRSAGNVEIEFADTGCGMPESMLESLGRPFQTTKAKGMGLGFAISKRIVEAHGGNISVKTKAGEGTTMTIRLPMQTEVVEVKPK